MKFTISIITIIISLLGLAACGDRQTISNNAVPPPNTATPRPPTPAPTEPQPIKDGNYKGKGTVYKIDLNLGSVGLNHEDIVGLMPAMQMEFYVTDKALLNGLAIGDKVDFVIAYKGGRETINSIKKTP